MTRVALFFDGKNHMKDHARAAGDRWIDHSALASWVVEHVGGTQFVAAHYYTGVPNPAEDTSSRRALTDLLKDLESCDGFFVHRFLRHSSTSVCPACGHAEPFTREKMVDTSIVADMILFAVRDAFDVAIIFSADLDVAPAVNAIHALGKRACVATFGRIGMSPQLNRAAWSVIDLSAHLDAFTRPRIGEGPPPSGEPTLADVELLRELRRAEDHFTTGGGFVGAHYFLHRWKGHAIVDDPEQRREAIERLIHGGLAETYDAGGGKMALRTLGVIEDDAADPSVDELLVADEE